MRKALLLTLISLSCLGDKLIPIPIQKQITEADGVILGEYTGHIYKKDREGRIVTEASFKVYKSSGISSRYLLNTNQFTLHYEGGNWQGLNYENQNAPEFEEKTKYVILVEKDSFGFRPYYDKLGVYEIKGKNEDEYLRSQAFPGNHHLNKISYKAFDYIVSSNFGHELQEYNQNKINFKKQGNSRMIASEEFAEDSQVPSIHIFWLAMFFGFLGAMRIRSTKSRK